MPGFLHWGDAFKYLHHENSEAMASRFDHSYDFDPSYGMGLAELQAVEPPQAPAEFDEFWRSRYRRAMAVDPRPSLGRSRLEDPRWHVLDLSYLSSRAFSIRGWLLLPRQGEVRRGLVVGHGYGGREAPDFDFPVEQTAVLFPCFRGLSLSARAPISPQPEWHVLHDIDKPDRYVIGGCVDDLWIAVSVLTLLYPWLSGHIGYSGESFGGGIGGLAIGFDERIDRGHLSVPTFGHQELRLKLPSTGSAHSVQRYQARHGNAFNTLRLHDAANGASRITVPMLMSVALFDPMVAPPCQFAVANALPASKFNEIFILSAGHFDYPEKTSERAALNEKIRQFFKVS